jgi:hypothetical protein
MGISYKNMEQFQRQLHYFVNKEIPQNMMRRQSEIALHLLDILTGPAATGGTPVDTGFAVSNWRMNVDKMVSGTIGTYQKAKDRQLKWMANDPYRFKTPKRPAKPLTGRGRENFIKYAFEWGQNFNMTEWKRVGHIIYVYNNVKYLQVLENGHSKQAPKGWVKRAIVSTKEWCKSKGW